MNSNTPARSQLLSALKLLTTPPSKESVWIGPFDQLCSSAYALLKADELEFAERRTDEYYKEVFCQIVRLVSSDPAADPKSSDPLRNYVSALYFNAGFQRLTWAAERLITTLAAVECTCGDPPTITRDPKGLWSRDFGKSKKRAEKRLDHLKNSNCGSSQLPEFREMLNQFKGWSGPTYDPSKGWNAPKYDLNKALSVLRDQVNPKKHSVYDYKQVQESRPLMPTGDHWTPVDQISLAVHAFAVVCRAYRELLDWNLKASLK